MLVLSRKRGERIVIADNIIITVVEVRGDKVRLGIEAPETVPVNRYEVLQSLQSKGEKHIHKPKLPLAEQPISDVGTKPVI